MRLLVDTHVIIWSAQEPKRVPPSLQTVLSGASELWVSACSIWEMRIKVLTGRLSLVSPPLDVSRAFLEDPANILPVTAEHAAHVLPDPPATRDPFDYLLLAQCDVEGFTLVTADARLAGHRLVAA